MLQGATQVGPELNHVEEDGAVLVLHGTGVR